jgi:hypothetical protein
MAVAGENCMKRRFIICTVTKHQEDQVKEDAKGGHEGAWGKREMCTKCWLGNPRRRGHFGTSWLDGSVLLRIRQVQI